MFWCIFHQFSYQCLLEEDAAHPLLTNLIKLIFVDNFDMFALFDILELYAFMLV